MEKEPPSDISSMDVSSYIRESWDSVSIGVKVALLIFVDASLGLRYQSGIFSLLFNGDFLWIIQFFEYVLSSFFLLYSLINALNGFLKKAFLGLTPIFILLIFAFCLDQLFIGQEITASISFPLTSTFFSGLYWGAAYLSIAVGLTLIYKVQNFGNFAQAEMMLVGAYVGFTMMWSPFFYTFLNGEKILHADIKTDEALSWDTLFWACISGFMVAGIIGVIIDRLVYQRFRKRNALPQAMMIASLGMAMIMRAVLYLRYGAEQFLFVPDVDWRLSSSSTEFSSEAETQPFYGFWPQWMNQTFRFRFGERTAEEQSRMDETACTEEGKVDGSSSEWSSSEDFIDSNENGRYDNAEAFIIDVNGNGIPEQGEYIDANGNGQYDEAEIFTDTNGNGVWDDGLCTITEYLSFYESGESSYFLQYTKSSLIIGVFAAVIMLIFMLNWTRLGRQMRAVADNPDLAASSGINVERIHATTAFLAAGMSGFGGVLFGMYVRVNPEVGLSILLPAFSVIILGTLGSVRGALIAAIIVGLVRSIAEPILIGSGSALDRPSYAAFGEAMPYMFLIAVLMVMPKGLGHVLNEWQIERAKSKNEWRLISSLPSYFSSILNWVYLPTLRFSSLKTRINFKGKRVTEDGDSEPDRFVEGDYLSEKIQAIDSSFTGTLGILGVVQVIIVSILDIYTSGQGTAYYLIDFIYLLLQIIGILMIYFSLAHYQTDMKLYVIDVYFQIKDTSFDTKRNLLSSGFLILILLYSIDYFVAGVGLFYLALDYVFLFGQLFGILMILFSTFFLFDELKLLTPSKLLGELTYRINFLFLTIAFLLLTYESKIEPSSARETDSTLYVKEIAYIFGILALNDVTRLLSKMVIPVQKTVSDSFIMFNQHINLQSLVFGLLLVMFDHWFWGILFILYSSNEIVKRVSEQYKLYISQINDKNPRLSGIWPKYGRASEDGSWFTFLCFLVVLIYIVDWLPSVTAFTKAMQVSRVIVLVCIFSILAFSLNLHTGFTGMTNFGVIFFAGLGAITTALLTVPSDKSGGHGWAPILGIFSDDFGSAILAAVFVSGLAGWLLAYPTARLRMDYFAIVTISLGEIVRISMRAEPLLRAGTGTTAIGIQMYNLPLEHWWESSMDDHVGKWLGLGEAAPYTVLLAAIALISFLLVWITIEMVQSSPWGRILRAIREDEEVTMHHGHNVFQSKAMSLALGGAIAGFGGGMWAWLNASVLDDFINPVKTTFLVWAAFIVGGRANNRGMVIGAFMIALTEPLFNLLTAARGDTESSFHEYVSDIDGAFEWLVLDVFAFMYSDLSVTEVFGSGDIVVNLVYFKLMLIGLVILVSLMISERGLLPEVPKRPINPDSLEKTRPQYVWPIIVFCVVIVEIAILGVL